MFRVRSCKAFSLALRPLPTLAAALCKLLQSLRSGSRLLTRLLPLLRSFIRVPKAAAPVRPPRGAPSFYTKKDVVFVIIKNNIYKKIIKRKAFEGVGACRPLPPWLLFPCVKQFEIVSQMAFHASKKVRSIAALSTMRKTLQNKLRLRN